MIVRHSGKTYEHELSDALMCVPACLNMIFKRRNLPTYTQAEIACELGLIVPPRLASQYPCANSSDNENDWGVHPQAGAIDLFLQKKGVPLAFKYIDVRQLPTGSIIDFLSDNLRQDNDIVVGYDYATVFKEGKNVGHVSLIKSINSLHETIELVDPEDTHTVSVGKTALIQGIFGKMDGFWVFGQSDKRIIELFANSGL